MAETIKDCGKVPSKQVICGKKGYRINAARADMPGYPGKMPGRAYVYGIKTDTGFVLKGTVRHNSSTYSLYRGRV